ncbi:uracil-DNA glycosylase family protein [Salegentibacter maritimus]|uniref:Uracil-DNA glycosylase family protein n=1 Tax=Salegentibacter maritimus TaxID=2794347 RepID=A0ABS0TK25_9FLAO|nr:uracil-DNA glycosylase family protein [Salegentibacter maritimus]MBI6120369.1 uracil-DNA glycosylase family protein [Salegentibacter maritimus]
MQQLLKEARNCKFCEKHLPLGAKPIVNATKNSKIVLISQAPGRIVHQTGVAWNDQSGKKLREWLGVNENTFYQPNNFAILPMGFCYPGKAKTGDAPPRKECAPMWHNTILSELKNIELTILIGAYATNYYLPDDLNLTQKVKAYRDFLPNYWCLPHPSPVNRFWRTKNPWFEEEVVPKLQNRIRDIIA